jgi:hypothetical protein
MSNDRRGSPVTLAEPESIPRGHERGAVGRRIARLLMRYRMIWTLVALVIVAQILHSRPAWPPTTMGALR